MSYLQSCSAYLSDAFAISMPTYAALPEVHDVAGQSPSLVAEHVTHL